jgi:hypothetical protein
MDTWSTWSNKAYVVYLPLVSDVSVILYKQVNEMNNTCSCLAVGWESSLPHIKVKQSNNTLWRRIWEKGYSSYSFMTSAPIRVTPHPRFIPGERAPSTHWTGCWVGIRASLNTKARGKILCPRRRSNSDHPVFQSVVRNYTVWAMPAPLPLLISLQSLRLWRQANSRRILLDFEMEFWRRSVGIYARVGDRNGGRRK